MSAPAAGKLGPDNPTAQPALPSRSVAQPGAPGEPPIAGRRIRPRRLVAPSLSGTVFRGLLLFVLGVMVVFSLVLTGIYYLSSERAAEAQLAAQARDAAACLEAEDPADRPALLDEQFDGAIRYTLIDADGWVLYESAASAAAAGNHADRPEVRGAVEAGESAVARRSLTVGVDTVYAAVRLEDGAVIRLAESRESLAAFLSGLVAPVAVALLVAALLSLMLSRLITRRIMRPLDALDLATPLQNEHYAEMAPLLERIDSQQRTLRAQNRELARAESLRRDFSANVSHEMKTPLQVIAGYAELMENGLVPPEDVARFAGIIHDESQSMRALIDDVLTLSRLDEMGAPADEAAPAELRGIADRAVRRLRAVAAGADVAVSVEGEACWTRGSETLLEQMVYNLVQNGIRYNEPGGSVVVTVGREFAPAGPSALDDGAADASPAAATLAARAVIRVRDTGPGIPPEKREKVFERFYRLEKSRSKETGGTGLGLAIVKHAALQHGGSVEVRDADGGGAEFVVRLPLASPPAADARP